MVIGGSLPGAEGDAHLFADEGTHDAQCAQTKTASGLLCILLHQIFESAHVLQDEFGFPDEHLTGRGRTHALVTPLEQWDTEFPFKLDDLIRE